MNPQQISHYRVIEKLGAGGMGEVFLAEDTRLERRVALKLLPEELVGDEGRRRRFLTEARAASALSHPHVCVVYEVGETDDGRMFLAMEYVQGETLTDRAANSDLSIDEIVAIGSQVADALDAAHQQGVVHRDIKPDNININERGQVKVLDFGLAKRLQEPQQEDETLLKQTLSGQILGTPNYMSPEQALGREVDHRSDLFSLGVVLYELLTGRVPFAGASLGDTVHNVVNAQPTAVARFNYDVPAEVERIVLKCLQKDADRRYQSAKELGIDLANFGSESAAGDAARQSGVLATPASPSGEFTSPTTPPEEIKQSDIFVSCAQLDDQPLAPGKEGWVSQFQRNLKVRLEQLSGEPVKIATHPMPPGPAPGDDALYQNLSDVRTLVSIVSPPFAKSDGCRKGVEEFWQSAEQSGCFRVEDKPRLFKVVKAPVEGKDLHPRLEELFQQLMSFDFFERDQESGRFREFDEAFGDDARQQYYEKIYDLSYEIAQVLKLYGSQSAAATAQPTGLRVFLAETTSDLQADRDRLKRELLEKGHTVLPDRPLPLIAGELAAAVGAYLEQCDLAIHMVGERFGLVPEDSELSVVAQQNQLAAAESARRELERVIWMPRDVVARDARQSAFLRELVEEPTAHQGAEVIQDTLENLKEYLEDKWQREQESAEQAVDSAGAEQGVLRVYLICDRQDETAVEEIEDYFYGQGIEVSLPDFDQDEATVNKVHWQNLEDCDAALVYYGAASKSWVDIKLRDLLKATGYRDGRKIDVQGVYVAPPMDRRKERFKSLTADVYRAEGDSFQESHLEAFVARVREMKQSS